MMLEHLKSLCIFIIVSAYLQSVINFVTPVFVLQGMPSSTHFLTFH
jgi:hypothetical protein